jgi:hypothetical protein
MKIRRFEAGDVPAIARLNERLAAGGATDRVYPEGSEQKSGPIRERLFVASDDGEIRGGVWLREHAFRIGSADVDCGWLKYPVAESLVDPAFAGVPGSLLVQCLREQPRLMALGLGGHATPLARMLAKLKWTGVTVPLLVMLARPGRCLRELAPLRRSAGRRLAAAALSFTGTAWVGQRAFETMRRVKAGTRPAGYTVEIGRDFGPWADEVWLRTRDAYGFSALRDAAMLNFALPRHLPDTRCARIRRNGADVGWAFLVRHDFSAGTPDPNFGRLTVGLIADIFADPAEAPGVMNAALDALLDMGVDLVFSNQLHPVWTAACHDRGFISAPSTFAFYRSPAAEKLIGTLPPGSLHVDRGDCDGPIWYGGR